MASDARADEPHGRWRVLSKPRILRAMPPTQPPALYALLQAVDPPTRDQAWRELVDGHSRLLLKVASNGRGDYDSTMDRYAFVLDKLREDDYRRLRSYRPSRARFSTWLVVVARRLCTDFERERYGRVRTAAQGEAAATRRSLGNLAAMVQIAEDHVAAPDEAERALEEAERNRLLDEAVTALAPEDRLLVRLRYVDGVSVREIRDLLRYPTVFHVYRHLNAVHRALRDNLARSGLAEGDR